MLVSFSEDGLNVKFELIIPGLRCPRKITHALSKYPENALVLNEIFTQSSLNYGVEFNPAGGSYGPEAKDKNQVYRFKIERLPSPIKPEKAKVKVGYCVLFHFLVSKL